ncbi:hypothetical protein Pint_15778 [Pistacia integerrima]|uniref:Uncharacterized protein n=1 Tax=Pistacia integerrima TaxID=434235 RepID=A0ACC0ZA75_9ROSI|nr:hypothetical protein Pint_15778 [Pistacia integerrima]
MANKPTTLSKAISLARLFEAKVATQKKVVSPTKGVPQALKPPNFPSTTTSNSVKKPPDFPSTTTSNSVKKLSLDEVDERR